MSKISDKNRNLKSLVVLILFVCTIAFANTAWGGGAFSGKGESEEEKAFKQAMQQKAVLDLLNGNRTNNNNPNQ